MFCKECGAVIVGKYCSCCGTRVRSTLQEFRLAERRAKKAFLKEHAYKDGKYLGIVVERFASACWHAATFRYGKYQSMVGPDNVPSEAFEELEIVTRHAERLFCALLNF